MTTEKRKVLLVGGSSVWFGVDAALIQRGLGLETLNLGLHAMRPLDQLVNEVRPALRSGDTVVMPLKFEYYLIDTPHNDWYVNEVMAGTPNVFWNLSWREKVSFFLAVPPMRVLEGVATRVSAFSEAELQKPNPWTSSRTGAPLDAGGLGNASHPGIEHTFRNIDPQGNAVVVQGTFTSYVYPINLQTVAPNYPWHILAEFARYCADRGVSLYIGWPPVVAGEVAFESSYVRDNVQTILRHLRELGIPVLGVPEDFQYDRQFFADNGYHLNYSGRNRHTMRVLRCSRRKDFSMDVARGQDLSRCALQDLNSCFSRKLSSDIVRSISGRSRASAVIVRNGRRCRT